MGAGIAQVMAIAGHDVVCQDVRPDALAEASALAAATDRPDRVVSSGDVANRAYVATLREAARVVEEGVASSDEVDQLMVDCFRRPSGPSGMTCDAGSGWS